MDNKFNFFGVINGKEFDSVADYNEEMTRLLNKLDNGENVTIEASTESRYGFEGCNTQCDVEDKVTCEQEELDNSPIEVPPTCNESDASEKCDPEELHELDHLFDDMSGDLQNDREVAAKIVGDFDALSADLASILAHSGEGNLFNTEDLLYLLTLIQRNLTEIINHKEKANRILNDTNDVYCKLLKKKDDLVERQSKLAEEYHEIADEIASIIREMDNEELRNSHVKYEIASHVKETCNELITRFNEVINEFKKKIYHN
jgi:hypothetical protein